MDKITTIIDDFVFLFNCFELQISPCD
ncbi:uncharacterized protein METZ01_LOCUS440688 [marine metagenome]|uniref:Uncharacterized protein n=1 Tax=marine metagenome TaxID=408172 RepID=A0A382YX65_9ZZZZ